MADYGPVKRVDGAVGAQGFDRGFAGHDCEFFGFDQLRFAAAVYEIAHDLHAGHVLPGGEFGAGGGDEAALAVDNVGHHAAVAGIAQAADEKFEIFDAGDHAQDLSAGRHGCRNQNNGFGFAAAAEGESLSAIGAAFACGGKGAFEFALEKGVGQDSSGGDAFRLRVEERGVSKVVGGRNKVFQQRAQLGTLDALVANVAAAGDLHRVREIGEHHVEGVAALRDIFGQRARDRVLQQHFVGLEAVAIDSFEARGIEIHGHNANGEQHPKNDVEDGQTRGRWRSYAQNGSLSPLEGVVAADG